MSAPRSAAFAANMTAFDAPPSFQSSRAAMQSATKPIEAEVICWRASTRSSIRSTSRVRTRSLRSPSSIRFTELARLCTLRGCCTTAPMSTGRSPSFSPTSFNAVL